MNTPLLHISTFSVLCINIMKMIQLFKGTDEIEIKKKQKMNVKSVKDTRSGWPIVKLRERHVQHEKETSKVEIKSNLYPHRSL